jgi:hypothetical protein
MEGLLTRRRSGGHPRAPWAPALRRRAADESGISLVLSLMVCLVVLTLGATWMQIGSHASLASSREALRDRARNAAEGGVNVAMGRLAGDLAWSGQGLSTQNSAGEFEVSVAAVSADPADTRRIITATGYAPGKAAANRVTRRMAQQVELVPTDNFRYALFASPGGITANNRLTVTGDIYSHTNLSLSNNETVNGNVTSLGAISTSNQSLINGRVHAAGAASIQNTSTVINGDLLSGGNVTMTGRVKGNVQAAGTISGGTVDGSRNPNSAPVPPSPQALPTFTWVPANYPSTTTWATPALFQAYWSANKNSFAGHHRVLCAGPCTTGIDLNSKWTMSGDVTIVSDSTITMSREVTNGSSPAGTLTLAVISLAIPSGSAAAVSMTNNIVLDDIKLLIYAPDGMATFGNLKSFSGAVYAKTIDVGQQFTLNFTPLSVPGFSFALSSSTHFQVVAGPFREIPN